MHISRSARVRTISYRYRPKSNKGVRRCNTLHLPKVSVSPTSARAQESRSCCCTAGPETYRLGPTRSLRQVWSRCDHARPAWLRAVRPNFRTVAHSTVEKAGKTADSRSRRRFVVLKIAALFWRALSIERVDASMLASMFGDRSSHGWTKKIKARPSVLPSFCGLWHSARKESGRAETFWKRILVVLVGFVCCFSG